MIIALPLIYEEYYEKNKDDIEYLDIRSFLISQKLFIVSFQFLINMSRIASIQRESLIGVPI